MATTHESPGAMSAAQTTQAHHEAAAVAAAAAAAQQLQQASPTQQHQQLHQQPLQHQQLQQQPLAQQSLQHSPLQQHPSPQSQNAAHPQQTVQTSAIDSLTCQWVGCGERCQSPEALYEHVCERHVGRKSTNNLNLTCQWGACRTTTVKRDHITSHIRVHVPLKPHKCDFCGKAFKRPQDLKKHVKTHADDSVLLRSPDPNMAQNRANSNGYQGQAPSAYYPSHDMGNPGAYPHPTHGMNPTNNFYQPPQQQYAGYGQVNYPTNSSITDIQSLDTRRRAIEALNDFLGDIKRRAIDPGNYYDVGQRLQSQNLPLPISTGYGYSTGNSYNANSSYNNTANSLLESFGASTGAMSLNGGAGSMAHGSLNQSYSLPLPNARTKTDLQDIDRFLEQLQSTVYENSNSAAAAGVQQPGVHAQYTQYPGFGNHYRHSDSPPNMQHSSSSAGLGSLSALANVPSSSALETPALTPASVSSYTSAGHSPMSTHSRSSMSSVNGSSMYPSLPSVAAVSDMSAGYPATTSAPPSGLASGFDGFEGRRYSGGRLQREAPAPRAHADIDSDAMDTESDGAKTPRASKQHDTTDPSSLDPALRATPQAPSIVHSPSTGTSSEPVDDRAQETWVENIRVIEALRKWISERIANQEYEHEQHEDGPKQEVFEPHHEHHEHQEHLTHHHEQQQHPEHTEQQQQHQDQEQQPAAERDDAGIAYPVLKVEA